MPQTIRDHEIKSVVIIRDAQPGELGEVGELRVAAYLADGFLSEDSRYLPRLRGLGSDGEGTVLAAFLDTEPDRIVGTVMLQPAPHSDEVVKSPDEAEIRALAVAPQTQGHGIGRALLEAIMKRAAEQGVRHLVLATQLEMHAAHRLYERAGFQRLPERDWEPQPGTKLIVYGLRLDEPGPDEPGLDEPGLDQPGLDQPGA